MLISVTCFKKDNLLLYRQFARTEVIIIIYSLANV